MYVYIYPCCSRCCDELENIYNSRSRYDEICFPYSLPYSLLWKKNFYVLFARFDS